MGLAVIVDKGRDSGVMAPSNHTGWRILLSNYGESAGNFMVVSRPLTFLLIERGGIGVWSIATLFVWSDWSDSQLRNEKSLGGIPAFLDP